MNGSAWIFIPDCFYSFKNKTNEIFQFIVKALVVTVMYSR